jgi:hypothetical protein
MQNWRVRPLIDDATIIDLIAATTTRTGSKVEAVRDTTGADHREHRSAAVFEHLLQNSARMPVARLRPATR